MNATEQQIVIGRHTLTLWHYADDASELPTLPDLSNEDWYESADDSASNGMDAIYVWHLDETRQLEVSTDQGYPVNVAVENRRTLAEALADWDRGDAGLGEFLEDFGLDGRLAHQKAPEGYDGECWVWRTPNYYSGHSNPPRGARAGYNAEEHWGDEFPWYADYADADGILVFPDRATAQRYVDDYYTAPSAYDGIPACNVLSHGQAGADTLTIMIAE